VIFIFDYSLEDAFLILKECDDFRIINHALNRTNVREVTIGYIEKCLKSLEPLGINKTRENRFSLIYPHETKSSEDLYIIIEINDFKEIEVITIYTKSIFRRLREYAT
jgi:hypothetical protein